MMKVSEDQGASTHGDTSGVGLATEGPSELAPDENVKDGLKSWVEFIFEGMELEIDELIVGYGLIPVPELAPAVLGNDPVAEGYLGPVSSTEPVPLD